MLQYAVLGSGSSGNSYVFSDGQVSLLIDQGYSVAELTRRLAAFSIPLQSIQAVCVTHLHPDHVRGVGVLCRKLSIPVYFSSEAVCTQQALVQKLGIPEGRLMPVTPFEVVSVGPFSLFCFGTSHDSTGSVGWYVTYAGEQLMVLTDTGITSEEQKQLACQASVLFLEANYDPKMLKNGPYPAYLKRRIDGRFGHLSNEQALSFLQESGFRGNHVYFIHLSDINNDPTLLEEAAHAVTQLPFTVCRKNQCYGQWGELV
ncbi:MAG: MBL fold metallo-hydrolase [Sphaerochaeta sp.]|jgi:phosphoribosyl 1,2-cyclic phosphodiesterase|uniref:MBL fold metallo-hydrolase n=1 Tax=Sphaerochaeta sp. TaxID=1972642 RepID=UPI002FC8F748